MQTLKIKFDEPSKTIALLIEEGARYSWDWVIALLKSVEDRAITSNVPSEDATLAIFWDEEKHKLELHYNYKLIRSYTLALLIVNLALQQAEFMRSQARLQALQAASQNQLVEQAVRQNILRR